MTGRPLNFKNLVMSMPKKIAPSVVDPVSGTEAHLAHLLERRAVLEGQLGGAATARDAAQSARRQALIEGGQPSDNTRETLRCAEADVIEMQDALQELAGRIEDAEHAAAGARDRVERERNAAEIDKMADAVGAEMQAVDAALTGLFAARDQLAAALPVFRIAGSDGQPVDRASYADQVILDAVSHKSAEASVLIDEMVIQPLRALAAGVRDGSLAPELPSPPVEQPPDFIVRTGHAELFFTTPVKWRGADGHVETAGAGGVKRVPKPVADAAIAAGAAFDLATSVGQQALAKHRARRERTGHLVAGGERIPIADHLDLGIDMQAFIAAEQKRLRTEWLAERSVAA